MTQTIEFFYDFQSPYSYMAYTQLTGMPVGIALRPIKLLKVMELVGNVPTTLTCAAKGRYASVDLARWGHRYGVQLNPSDIAAIDGEALLRAVLSAGSSIDAAGITLALYRAIWSEGKTLVGRDDILAVIAAAGINSDVIADRIDTPEVAAVLDAWRGVALQR